MAVVLFGLGSAADQFSTDVLIADKAWTTAAPPPPAAFTPVPGRRPICNGQPAPDQFGISFANPRATSRLVALSGICLA
jgi:hypothetical protein